MYMLMCLCGLVLCQWEHKEQPEESVSFPGYGVAGGYDL